MFRVLSEEETRSVKRWQAPELNPDAARVANTRQQGKPQQSQTRRDARPLLGSRELQPSARLQQTERQPVAPDLQSIDLVDVFAAKNAVAQDARGANTDTLASDHQSAVTAQMLQSSYDQGYEKGLEDAAVAAQQQSVTELRSVISAISEAPDQIADPAFEQEVLALTMEIARLAIRRELTVQPDIMLDIINAGIEQLGGGRVKTRKVILNPIDANVIRQYLPEDSDIAVLDDPSMLRGGCRIETATSIVDAGIEDWLQTVSAQLLAQLPD